MSKRNPISFESRSETWTFNPLRRESYWRRIFAKLKTIPGPIHRHKLQELILAEVQGLEGDFPEDRIKGGFRDGLRYLRARGLLQEYLCGDVWLIPEARSLSPDKIRYLPIVSVKDSKRASERQEKTIPERQEPAPENKPQTIEPSPAVLVSHRPRKENQRTLAVIHATQNLTRGLEAYREGTLTDRLFEMQGDIEVLLTYLDPKHDVQRIS